MHLTDEPLAAITAPSVDTAQSNCSSSVRLDVKSPFKSSHGLGHSRAFTLFISVNHSCVFRSLSCCKTTPSEIMKNQIVCQGASPQHDAAATVLHRVDGMCVEMCSVWCLPNIVFSLTAKLPIRFF